MNKRKKDHFFGLWITIPLLVLLALTSCQASSPEPPVPTEEIQEVVPSEKPTVEELTVEELQETTPPGPINLSATNTQEGIRLEWEPAPASETTHGYSDAILHYNIYRRVEGGSQALLANVTETFYVDQAVEEGKAYSYSVSAVHEGPVESLQSEEVTLTGGPMMPELTSPEDSSGVGLTFEELQNTTPPSPVNLRVTITPEGVRLAWEPAPAPQSTHAFSDIILHYNIYRRSGNESQKFLATSTDIAYIDPTVAEGMTYFYAVSAVHEGPVEGLRTEEVTPTALSGTTEMAPSEDPTGGMTFEELVSTTPLAPVNLRAAHIAEGIRLEWDPAPASEIAHGYSDLIIHYNIYRRSGGENQSLLTTVAGTSFVDQSAGAGTTYYYTVSAVHEGPVEGMQSQEAAARR